MKKLLFFFSFLLLGSSLLTAAYPKVTIRNSTPFDIQGEVNYAGCSTDQYSIAPYATWTATSRGVCLVTKVGANVTETAQGLKRLGYGATQAERGQVAAQGYQSSGTSYSQFAVIGPVIDSQTQKRVYQVTRLVQ